MSNELILVALSTFANTDRGPLRMLEASGHPFRIHDTGKRITTTELLRDAATATVIIAGVEPYDAPTLQALPALRCISRCGVGTDAIDLAAARERSIVVVNTPDVPTAAVAELALSMFLSLSRNLRPQSNSMGRREWKRLEAHLLSGRTVGLVGFGRIGRRVAELSRAFGARVLASDPFADAQAARAMGVELVPLERVLHDSDIVSLHAAQSADKPLKLGASEFSSMKRGSLLVNLARGNMIDEAALVAALTSGQLAGAGLDVFGEEPYTGALCDFEQVMLTPHSATTPVETRVAMETECVENALRFLDGRLLPEQRVV